MLCSGSNLLKVNFYITVTDISLTCDKRKKTARKLNVFNFLFEPYWRRINEHLFEWVWTKRGVGHGVGHAVQAMTDGNQKSIYVVLQFGNFIPSSEQTFVYNHYLGGE